MTRTKPDRAASDHGPLRVIVAREIADAWGDEIAKAVPKVLGLA